MKRITYLSGFTLLGALLMFIFVGIGAQAYFELLITNFDLFSLYFSWTAWSNIYRASLIAFPLLGAWIGFSQGMYWWKRIYGT